MKFSRRTPISFTLGHKRANRFSRKRAARTVLNQRYRTVFGMEKIDHRDVMRVLLPPPPFPPIDMTILLVSTIIFNVPINLATGRWNANNPPENWRETRNHWEFFQGLRSWPLLIGFRALVFSRNAVFVKVIDPRAGARPPDRRERFGRNPHRSSFAVSQQSVLFLQLSKGKNGQSWRNVPLAAVSGRETSVRPRKRKVSLLPPNPTRFSI